MAKKRNAEPEVDPRKTGIKDNDHKSGKQARARDQRRADAIERQAAYDALTVDEKVARATAAPGNAARELKRLGAL